MKPEDENKEPPEGEEQAGFRFSPSPGGKKPPARPDETKPGTTPPVRRQPGLRPVVLTARSGVGRKQDAPGRPADGTASPDETRPGGRPRVEPPDDMREERRSCSFPGLLKVIFPESSFLPVPVAVRVANLSVRGAMIEIHDRSKMPPNAVVVNRFFELKIAHQALPALRGTVAWTDFSRTNPQFGLAFADPCPEVEDLLSAEPPGGDSEGAPGPDGPPPLEMPKLDPFPGVAMDTRFVITGRAPEAVEVRVRGEDRLFKAPVEGGRFELTLDLEPGGKNFFYLRSYAGERRSKSVPLRIACEKEKVRRRDLFEVETAEEKNGGRTLRMKFHGRPGDAERVLYRLSQLMGQAERLELNALLETPGEFDELLVQALEDEGDAMLED